MAGRKPFYHELLLEEEAALLADILRFVIPESVTVSSRDGHLIVYQWKLVRKIFDSDPKFYRSRNESDEEALWRAVESGNTGELLGYGAVRNINAPDSVLVLIVDGEKVVAGFYAPKDDPIPFARARAFDYSYHFQRDIEFIIEPRKTV